MNDNIYIAPKYNLSRLQKYLNYEVASSILYFLSFQVFIFIFIASAAALIFTPFMLHVLIAEKKKGWLVLFALIVVVPIVFFILLSVIVEFSRPLLFIPLGLFYFYCFILRFDVNEWVREAGAKHQYFQCKLNKEENSKLFEDNFN